MNTSMIWYRWNERQTESAMKLNYCVSEEKNILPLESTMFYTKEFSRASLVKIEKVTRRNEQ